MWGDFKTFLEIDEVLAGLWYYGGVEMFWHVNGKTCDYLSGGFLGW